MTKVLLPIRLGRARCAGVALAAIAALPVATLVLAGCGAAAGSPGPAPSTTRAAALVLTRTGGIAGFHDTLRVASDGTATLTRRSGPASTCRVEAAALTRLRALGAPT